MIGRLLSGRLIPLDAAMRLLIRSCLVLALLVGLVTGEVTSDYLVGVCALALSFAAGGTYGLYLGWTHWDRMNAVIGARLDAEAASVSVDVERVA